MKIDIKDILRKYSLLFFFLIIFAFIFIAKINLREIWCIVSSIKVWQIFIIILSSFFISGVNIFNRKYLLKSLGFNTSIRNLVLVHFSSMAAHYSTPVKIGYPVTVYLLRKFEDIPYSSVTAMIFWELVVSTGLCGIIAVIGAFQFFSGNIDNLLIGVFLFIFVIITSLLIAHIFITRGNKGSKIYKFISNSHFALSSLPLRKVAVYIILDLLRKAVTGIFLVIIISFFSSTITIWQAMVSGSTAFFLGAISMIPMGLGVREASMLFYLSSFGIPKEIGIAVVTIQRLLSTGLAYILGLIAGGILGIKNVRKEQVTIDP